MHDCDEVGPIRIVFLMIVIAAPFLFIMFLGIVAIGSGVLFWGILILVIGFSLLANFELQCLAEFFDINPIADIIERKEK